MADDLGEGAGEGFDGGGVAGHEGVEEAGGEERDVYLVEGFSAGEEIAEGFGAFGGVAHVGEEVGEMAFGAGGARLVGPIGERGKARGEAVRADEMVLPGGGRGKGVEGVEESIGVSGREGAQPGEGGGVGGSGEREVSGVHAQTG